MATRPKSSKPRHQQVYETLSREIRSGRYRPGQKFPSEAALVTRFRVSRITAGRAVHDLQRRGLVERFAGSGTYVAAADAPAGQSLLFGLIIPDLGRTEIFEPICQGIAGAPSPAGHALIWPHASAANGDREEQAWELCRQCIERKVAGVFFAPLEMSLRSTEVNRGIVAALGKAGVPTIFLDRRPEHMASRDRCDLVGLDNDRAGFIAATHLLNLGARRLGFVKYRGQASSVAGRVAGFREALLSRPKTAQKSVIFDVEPGERFELPEQAERCDGLVCSNDHIAGRVMLACIAKGMRIPKDLRIVGIDDVSYAELLPVPLTTVRQPCAEIGAAALAAMLERLAHPAMPAREILLDCELVIRRSCGS